MASNLSVNVTADTTDLRTKLALAQADLKAFGAETRQLAQSIRAGGDSTGALRGQLQSVAAQFNRAKGEAAGLTANLRNATGAARESATAIMSVGASSTGIMRISGAISTVVGSLGAMRGALAPVAGLIAAGFATQRIFSFAQAAAAAAEQTENTGAAVGETAQEMSVLESAFQIAGASAETAARSIQALQSHVGKALADPTSESARAFAALGISMGQLEATGGKFLPVMRLLADAFVRLEDGARKTTAFAALGVRLQQLAPLLKGGSAGFDELTDAARKVGAELDGRTIRALTAVDDKFDLLGISAQRLGQRLVAGLAGPIGTIIDALTNLITKFNEALRIKGGAETAAGQASSLSSQLAAVNSQIASLEAAQSKAAAGGYAAQGPFAAIGKAAGPLGGADLDRLRERARDLQAQIDQTQADAREIARGEALGTGPLRRPQAKDIEPAPKAERKGPKGPKDDTVQRELERLTAEDRVDGMISDRRAKLIEATQAAGRISLASEYQLLVENLEQRRAAEENYYEQKRAAAAADLKELQKVNEEKAKSDQDYLTKRQDLDLKFLAARKTAEEKAAADSQAAWDKVFQPLESSFDNAIKGFVQGTTTLYQGLSRAGETLLLDPLLKNITGGLKTAFQESFGDISGGAIGKFFSGTLFGGVDATATATAAANTTALGVASTSAAAEVTALGLAASGAATALGGSSALSATGGATGGGGPLGLLGSLFGSGVTSAAGAATAEDALAEIFSTAATTAVVFNRGGIVPSAAGGWMVPQTGSGGVLANLHSREMVLPRNISEGLQAALGGGGAMTSNRSQAINLTYAPSINAPSHMGLEKILARDSRAMTGFISSRVRDGALELPGGWRG